MRLLTSLSIFLVWLSFAITPGFAKDQEIVNLFSLMKDKNWAGCQKIADKKNISALKKIVLVQKYLDVNSQSSFEEITGFLSKNPEWPGNKGMRANAEHAIDCTIDKQKIINWFNKHPPITGSGHKFYAYAYIELAKPNDPRLETIIKNGWIYGNFSPAEQNAYHARFKGYLTTRDHIRKIDNNLFNDRLTAAKVSLNFVPFAYRESFKAQTAFIIKQNNALSLFKKIPKQYYTPGLIYQYINHIKANPPSSAEVTQLIDMIKHVAEYGNKFNKLQIYIAREYIEQKKYADAYKIISKHFAQAAEEYSNSEFLAGWLALRFLHKPDLALKHFINFDQKVKSPISKSRGKYWAGRAYFANGEREKAKTTFKETAEKYPYTYYGQLAANEIGLKSLSLPSNINITERKDEELVKNKDLLHAAKIVSEYGPNGMAQTYLTAVVGSLDDQKQILALASSIATHKNIHHNVWLAKNAAQKHVFIKNFGYPTPYNASNLMTEPPLTYSIIRQESVFDQYAVSSARAMGLMQVIEGTACRAAKNIGTKCEIAKLKTDPNYNMQIGSYYLNEMIDRYNGSYILAIASYNAGPHKIEKWLKLYGDPRGTKDLHKIIDWIELIPYYETRNYVQRVIEGLQIYRAIINKDNKLNIKEDLMLSRRI